MSRRGNKILLALSGGVDSALSVALLKEKGFEVIGVYFLMQPGDKKKLAQVKIIADYFGIELLTKDVSRKFEKEVVDYFVAAYEKNITPNPCVACNPKIKFFYLKKIADELGISKIATGHYARISETKHGVALKRAKDKLKDQSYFLYRLNQKELASTVFPLGKYEKKKIIRLAKQMGLPLEAKESQNVCFFLEQEKLKNFLAKRIKTKTGEIVDETGAGLGKHQGLNYYTQGQRFGLGLSGGPFFVVDKDLKKNLLVVSKNRNHPRLMVEEIIIENASWIGAEPRIGKKYSFKSRYQIKETTGQFRQQLSSLVWTVRLDEPQWAVAAGQSLVAYDGEVVVGGGMIV